MKSRDLENPFKHQNSQDDTEKKDPESYYEQLIRWGGELLRSIVDFSILRLI